MFSNCPHFLYFYICLYRPVQRKAVEDAHLQEADCSSNIWKEKRNKENVSLPLNFSNEIYLMSMFHRKMSVHFKFSLGEKATKFYGFFLTGYTSDLMESEQSQSKIQSSESQEN